MALVKKIDITQTSSKGNPPLLGRIEVEAINSQAMILPDWIAYLYSLITSKIDQLQEVLRLVYINQCILSKDYPGLITHYQEMRRSQHCLFDYTVVGTQQS